MSLNQAVSIFALVLSCCVALIMYRLRFPDRIVFGAAVLSILFVAIVWSTTCLILKDFNEDDD